MTELDITAARKTKKQQFTKDQESLLLYFETCLVDYGGRVNSIRMNDDDFANADKWNASGFIKFGRIAYHDINRDGNIWVTFSADAWKYAHRLRKARAKRNTKKYGFERIHRNTHRKGVVK